MAEGAREKDSSLKPRPPKGEKSAEGKDQNNSIALDYGGFPGLTLIPSLIKIQHVMYQFNDKAAYSHPLFPVCTSPRCAGAVCAARGHRRGTQVGTRAGDKGWGHGWGHGRELRAPLRTAPGPTGRVSCTNAARAACLWHRCLRNPQPPSRGSTPVSQNTKTCRSDEHVILHNAPVLCVINSYRFH